MPLQQDELYVVSGGEQVGPVSEDQVKNLLISGRLKLSDLAWKAGLTEWVSLNLLLNIAAKREEPPALPPRNDSKRPRWKSPPVIAWGALIVMTVVLYFLDQSESAIMAELRQIKAYVESRRTEEYAAFKLLEAATSSDPLGVLDRVTEEQRRIAYHITELGERRSRASEWTTAGLIAWWLCLLAAITIQIRWFIKRRRATM